MKIYRLSVQQLLHYVDIAISGALTIPELRQVLQDYSLDDKKIQAGQRLVNEVTVWQDRQETAQAQARRAQRTFQEGQQRLKALHRSHREAARFAYRNDNERLYQLAIAGRYPTRYADWLILTRQFYTHLDAKAMAKYGVSAAEIAEAKALLSKMPELEVLRNDTRRQAQQATQKKQAAVQELRAWFGRFMRIARLACADDLQLLESMGVVVPS